MSLSDEKVRADQESTHLVADEVVSVDTKEAIRRNTHYLLLEEMGDAFDPSGDQRALRTRLERRLDTLLGHDAAPLSEEERLDLTGEVVDGLLGYGPLDRLLEDPSITEIMVNGPHQVYVERSGKIYEHDRVFVDGEHLLRVIAQMLASVGQHVDDNHVLDSRLPDGTLLNVIMPPLAIDGPLLTLRKPVRDPFTVDDLIAFGTMTEEVADFLAACVQGRLNMLVSGGMRSGKTTTLNVLASYVPAEERIVTVEDATELQLKQEHVARLATRPAGVAGVRGGATARDLVANSMRMRPDRIIVGELQGGEAFGLLQAMNTGHDGALASVYAASPSDALDRVETMTMLGGTDVQRSVIREQVAAAFHVIVHVARLRDGTRRVVQISEVGGVESDVVKTTDLFRFDASNGLDEDGRFKGHIRSTGVAPGFTGRLEEMGVQLQRGLFH
jgi:pilus assembly protein CpaF